MDQIEDFNDLARAATEGLSHARNYIDGLLEDGLISASAIAETLEVVDMLDEGIALICIKALELIA